MSRFGRLNIHVEVALGSAFSTCRGLYLGPPFLNRWQHCNLASLISQQMAVTNGTKGLWLYPFASRLTVHLGSQAGHVLQATAEHFSERLLVRSGAINLGVVDGHKSIATAIY